MSRVTISMKTARWFMSLVPPSFSNQGLAEAVAELRRAMEPTREPREPLGVAELAGAAMPSVVDPYIAVAKARAEKRRKDAARKAQKRAETADLWKQAMARSGGFCECKCGRAFHEEGDNKPEMDHEASRRVPQTICNVWMLARVCHHQRQANKPSEVHWLRIFLQHCNRHGYLREADRVVARIVVVEVKTALPASPTRSMLGAGLRKSTTGWQP